MRALLAGIAIVVSTVVQSLFVAVGLACLLVVIELAHIAWEKHQARVLRAKFEADLAETPWRLVPGPGA
jgi:hypothetical protein